MKIARFAQLLIVFVSLVVLGMVTSLSRPTAAHASPSASVFEGSMSDGGFIQIEVLEGGVTAAVAGSFQGRTAVCPLDAYMPSIPLGQDERTVRMHQKQVGNGYLSLDAYWDFPGYYTVVGVVRLDPVAGRGDCAARSATFRAGRASTNAPTIARRGNVFSGGGRVYEAGARYPAGVVHVETDEFGTALKKLSFSYEYANCRYSGRLDRMVAYDFGPTLDWRESAEQPWMLVSAVSGSIVEGGLYVAGTRGCPGIALHFSAADGENPTLDDGTDQELRETTGY